MILNTINPHSHRIFKTPLLPSADTSHCANLGQILVCRRTGPLQTSVNLRHTEQASSFPLDSAYIPRQCRYCERHGCNNRESRVFQPPAFSPGAPGSSEGTTRKKECVEHTWGLFVAEEEDRQMARWMLLVNYVPIQEHKPDSVSSIHQDQWAFVNRKISSLRGMFANTKQSHGTEGEGTDWPARNSAL